MKVIFSFISIQLSQKFQLCKGVNNKRRQIYIERYICKRDTEKDRGIKRKREIEGKERQRDKERHKDIKREIYLQKRYRERQRVKETEKERDIH